MPRFRMFSDRWTLFWVGLFLFLGAGFLLAYSMEIRRRTPFWDKSQTVQLGMTKEEVEAILGPPADVWEVSLAPVSCTWVEGEQVIIVHFWPEDRGEVVIKKRFFPTSLPERLRDFMKELFHVP